jgi:hypothetical protein
MSEVETNCVELSFQGYNRVEKNILTVGQNTIITRSYYRKESAASPQRNQRQHAQFAE